MGLLNLGGILLSKYFIGLIEVYVKSKKKKIVAISSVLLSLKQKLFKYDKYLQDTNYCCSPILISSKNGKKEVLQIIRHNLINKFVQIFIFSVLKYNHFIWESQTKLTNRIWDS